MQALLQKGELKTSLQRAVLKDHSVLLVQSVLVDIMNLCSGLDNTKVL